MAVNLTQGAILTMCDQNFSSEDLKPVLQVIDLKLVQSQQHRATDRYRLVLSDGSHYQQGMLATQKNELVHFGRLQKGSVVKLTRFICNLVQNRKIIVIIELDVIRDKCDLIGEPVAAPKDIPAQSFRGRPIGRNEALHHSRSNQLPQSGFPPVGPFFWEVKQEGKVTMGVNLTQGAIMTMCNGVFTSEVLKPVLQVIDLNLVQSQQHIATESYRLLLSDGSHYQQGMLATQKNELVHSGRLQKGSVVKLTQFFILNVVENCKIIIIIELDVIRDKCDLIGEPVPAPRDIPAQSFRGGPIGRNQAAHHYRSDQLPQSGFPLMGPFFREEKQEGKVTMGVNLTQGAIMTMCDQNFFSEDLKPVLQVIDLNLVQLLHHSATERYQLVLSDGSHYQQGMLAVQKNKLVHSGRLQKGSVIKLTQFTCNVVQNCRIIIIIELDVIRDKCDLIGEPVLAPKDIPTQSFPGGPMGRNEVPHHYRSDQFPQSGFPPMGPFFWEEKQESKVKMGVNLTQGAIMTMCNDVFTLENLKPVLQVIDLKKLVQSQQHSTPERYRLVLSDGSHYQQGMLATQKNELVYFGRLQKGSVVKLTQFICNVVQNRKIITIIDLDVILDKCDVIGEPVPASKNVPAQSAAGDTQINLQISQLALSEPGSFK